jgi:hypothetical protein
MTTASNSDERGELRDAPSADGEARMRTRRRFLTDGGKKAAFIAPVVLSLTAQPAMAASGESCSAYGAACEVNEDCCTLNCHALTMTCKGAIG